MEGMISVYSKLTILVIEFVGIIITVKWVFIAEKFVIERGYKTGRFGFHGKQTWNGLAILGA